MGRGGHYSGSRGGDRSSRRDDVPSGPSQYEQTLQKGFVVQVQGKPVMREELIGKFAPQWAKEFAEWGLTRNQIRNFFDETKAISDLLKEGHSFERLLPRIRLLWARVAHAGAKQASQKSVPPSFVEFIKASVQHVNTKEDFEGFAMLFEAVVGHFVYWEKPKGGQR